MEVFGSKPISKGASAVEPNMATTCCKPMAAVCGQDRRSSGATSPVVLRVHRGKKPLIRQTSVPGSAADDAKPESCVRRLGRSRNRASDEG